MQISNVFTANQLPLVNGILNAFNEENWQGTMEKVKAFAWGVFQGVLIALVVVSIAFLIGVGFTKGAEKATEIFNKLCGK